MRNSRTVRSATVVFIMCLMIYGVGVTAAEKSQAPEEQPAVEGTVPAEAPPPAKQSPFGAMVTLTSNYYPRGYSKSANEPAVQGSIDFKHKSGFYAGLWASSINFQDGDQAQIEMVPYVGFARPWKQKFVWNAAFLAYRYPGAPSSFNYDFEEALGSFTYYFSKGDAGISLYYSPNYTFDSGQSTYWSLDLNLKLPKDFGLLLHGARLNVEDNAAFFGTPDYNDYRIGLSKMIAGLKLSLDYAFSSLSQSECFGGLDICEDTGIFWIQKKF